MRATDTTARPASGAYVIKEGNTPNRCADKPAGRKSLTFNRKDYSWRNRKLIDLREKRVFVSYQSVVSRHV